MSDEVENYFLQLFMNDKLYLENMLTRIPSEKKIIIETLSALSGKKEVELLVHSDKLKDLREELYHVIKDDFYFMVNYNLKTRRKNVFQEKRT